MSCEESSVSTAREDIEIKSYETLTKGFVWIRKHLNMHCGSKLLTYLTVRTDELAREREKKKKIRNLSFMEGEERGK